MIFILLDEIQRRDKIIERQNNEILALKAEVSELKSRLNQNRNNSHKPPSSDPYRKAATLRKKSGKRGGKEGLQGKGMDRLQFTEEIELKVETEPCECGTDLMVVKGESSEVRQVQKIPEPQIIVIDYKQQKKTCTCCGKENFGIFPQGVNALVQYGNNVKTLSVLLCNY